MISDALSLLKDELNIYIKSKGFSGTEDEVVLGNIAMLELEEGTELKNKVVLSLVNMEEEKTLKNRAIAQKTLAGLVKYEQAPIHINLYILITANISQAPSGQSPYEGALKRLSYVIQFFQGRNTFTLANSPNSKISTQKKDEPEFQEFKLIMDFFSLTFEQINHLWGSLGGKQLPFVLYRGRLIKIKEEKPIGTGELIREIQAAEEIF